MNNKIFKICEEVLKITDREINEVRAIAKAQEEYSHPFKCATAAKQNEIGKFNNKVLDKLLELKEILEQGAAL